MSKYLLCLLLAACYGFAQAPEIQWEHKFGGSRLEISPRIISAHGGGYLVGLSTMSTDGDISASYGASDIWLVRLGALGNLLWEKSYGGNGYDFQPSMVATSDGGYVIAGSATPASSAEPPGDMKLIKIDGDGTVLWTRTFGRHAGRPGKRPEGNARRWLCCGRNNRHGFSGSL